MKLRAHYLATLCILLFLATVASAKAAVPEEEDISLYTNRNRRNLNRRAVRMLREYFSDATNWTDYVEQTKAIATDNKLRIVALGESHGYPETQLAEATMVEILHSAGYETLFIEIESKYQSLIDSFLGGRLTFDELDEKIEYIRSIGGRPTMEAAKRRGIRVIAMDGAYEKSEDARNVSMFESVLSRITTESEGKAVIIAGARHVAEEWYNDIEHIRPLAALLRERFANELVTVQIMPVPEFNVLANRVPHGLMIRTNISPIARIPCWTTGHDHKLRYPSRPHIMRYGDWDYLLIEPEPGR